MAPHVGSAPRCSWRSRNDSTGSCDMPKAMATRSNLEADLQMGAYSGTQLIWVLWWSTVMGLVLQLLAARLGVCTGKRADNCG